jgi:anti-sigma B factor antagonist
LTVKQAGSAAVVTLPAGDLFDEELIDLVGEYLADLVETSGCRDLVLDFGHVDRVASHLLGALLIVYKRVVGRGGRLVLCSLKPALREVFVTLRLDLVFTIRDGEEPALGERQPG